MALQNQAAIETEFTAKANVIRAVTETQVATTLQPVVDFAAQNEEAVKVFIAREALAGRPVSTATVESLKAQIAQMSDGVAAIKAAVASVKAQLDAILNPPVNPGI